MLDILPLQRTCTASWLLPLILLSKRTYSSTNPSRRNRPWKSWLSRIQLTEMRNIGTPRVWRWYWLRELVQVNRPVVLFPFESTDEQQLWCLIGTETWIPVVQRLYRLQARKQSTIHIEAIWAINSPNQGQGAILNEQTLRDHYSDVCK